MSVDNGGLDEGFDSQIPQTTAEIRDALATGLLSLDANVLLSFYRFSPTAQKALVEVLEALGDRLWVSHQAVREFWRNRCAAIDGRNQATETVQQSLEEGERRVHRGVARRADVEHDPLPAWSADRVPGSVQDGHAVEGPGEGWDSSLIHALEEPSGPHVLTCDLCGFQTDRALCDSHDPILSAHVRSDSGAFRGLREGCHSRHARST